jgi:hypothetical protein
MREQICPICDGLGKNFTPDKLEVNCWGCGGKGNVEYNTQALVSEKEIKTMFSVLGQR